ncbi:hypothetical protein L1987_64865 [Smallanthus sonchifolius]|uniref:Uncharacterized protein n=1 Tax=Smallanthus sonchifolius TaxID=185202 RepID=A0ACB9BSW3_9ASTR|nr:hypothetical protein L1987_64865 [Smallanthus sonchifolius]
MDIKYTLEEEIINLEDLLSDSRKKVKELENLQNQVFKMEKEKAQLQKAYGLAVFRFGLVDAAQNYHTVLTENRKLYNDVQDLKGIRNNYHIKGCFDICEDDVATVLTGMKLR